MRAGGRVPGIDYRATSPHHRRGHLGRHRWSQHRVSHRLPGVSRQVRSLNHQARSRPPGGIAKNTPDSRIYPSTSSGRTDSYASVRGVRLRNRNISGLSATIVLVRAESPRHIEGSPQRRTCRTTGHETTYCAMPSKVLRGSPSGLSLRILSFGPLPPLRTLPLPPASSQGRMARSSRTKRTDRRQRTRRQ